MPRSGVVRAAGAQIDVVPMDLAANVAVHEEMIDRARADGAQLLVFPELSLTGYAVGDRSYDIAMPWDDPLLVGLARYARDMTVVVGFVEEGYAAQFFNAAAVLRGGKVVFVHRKLNLATYGGLEEGKFFATGRYVEPFTLSADFTAVALICADMWNPALVHLAALHGATLLVAPTNSAGGTVSGSFNNPEAWDLVLSFYSTIYGLPIVMVNRTGTEDGLDFWGGSRIVGTRGEVLAAADAVETTLLVADVKYSDVRRARFELPTVRDSNLALVEREVGRLTRLLGVPDIVDR